MTRVFVADDHSIVREGLRAWVETVPELTWAGSAGDGAALLAQAAEAERVRLEEERRGAAAVRRCAGWERRDGVVESHSTSSSGRVGFWVSSGCPVAGSAFLPALSTLTDRWGPWYDGDSSRLRTDWDTDDAATTTCFYYRRRATDTWWYNTSVSSGERFVRTTGTYDFGSGASD